MLSKEPNIPYKSTRKGKGIRDKIRGYVFKAIHILFVFVKFDGECEQTRTIREKSLQHTNKLLGYPSDRRNRKSASSQLHVGGGVV